MNLMLAEMDLSTGVDEDATIEDKGVAAQTHASSSQWGAPPSSDPIAVPKSSSKPAFVPKLLLPTSQSPGAVLGKIPCCQLGVITLSVFHVTQGSSSKACLHV